MNRFLTLLLLGYHQRRSAASTDFVLFWVYHVRTDLFLLGLSLISRDLPKISVGCLPPLDNHIINIIMLLLLFLLLLLFIQLTSVQSQMQSKGGYDELSEIPVGSTPAGQFVVSPYTVHVLSFCYCH